MTDSISEEDKGYPIYMLIFWVSTNRKIVFVSLEYILLEDKGKPYLKSREDRTVLVQKADTYL